MDALDPDDPRPPFQQVANSLRAAIRTRKLEPGDRLPSYGELAERFGVSPMTVQKAIGVLRDEGLVVSRQGKGSFVRQRTERAVGLRPHVEEAFKGAKVAIDFAGFSGETLYGALQEPLDKIRLGRVTPDELTIRILLPDLTAPTGLPSLAPDGDDSAEVRKRMERISERSVQAITDTVQELADLELVRSATAKVRVYRGVPLFKLYLLNGEEAFFGFYPVVEHPVPINGAPVPIFDLMGKDATLFHFASVEDETSLGNQYIAEAQRWFDSVWSTVARDFAG
ncbi:winged helix-turn-helix domain-containing protein [Saccharopolyspora indica]|uniref:GntR family transcriptional regulator n=1 Tax=Saccharopolyspora indica TaxID=1229659 RepID=UPI0022EA4745|nr:GntR family transcriptional regulator [Saccharopolyspora indica]MDA3644154.1 GntR family transcriptional regulator [Saccharopolyspora indica]